MPPSFRTASPPGYAPDFVHCRKLFQQRLRMFTAAVEFCSWKEWLYFIRPVERRTGLLTYLTRDPADRDVTQ